MEIILKFIKNLSTRKVANKLLKLFLAMIPINTFTDIIYNHYYICFYINILSKEF